jgi:hypothetical protein
VVDPVPGDDIGADAAGRVLSEVGAPFPGADGELDGAGLGHEAEVAVGKKEQGADVAAVELVRPYGLFDGLGDLVLGVRGFHPGHARREEEAVVVLGQAEDGRPLGGAISPDALENGAAVMEGVHHGMTTAFGPVVELPLVPVFLGLGKVGVKKHGCLLRGPRPARPGEEE